MVTSLYLGRRVCNALIAVHLMIGLALASAAAEYSRTERFSPVRLTYEDMASLINRVHQFVTTANAPVSPDAYYSEEMTLRGSLSQIRLKKDFSISAFIGAPDEAYSVHYLYSRDSAPISRIAIDLGDYTREVTVEGSSSDQVAALLSLLSEDLRNRETYLGGALFRNICGALLLVLATIAPGVNFPSQTKTTRIALLITAPLIAIAVWVLPWDKWFPGTAIYAANASPLVRHSAIISLIGTAASLFALLSPLFRMVLHNTQPEEEATRKIKKSGKS